MLYCISGSTQGRKMPVAYITPINTCGAWAPCFKEPPNLRFFLSPYNRPPRAWRGSRGIALPILDLGARRGRVVSITLRSLYPRERPGTHCTGGWVGPRAGLDVCEKSHPTGIRSPDRPARSHSLYRLSYPACQTYEILTFILDSLLLTKLSSFIGVIVPFSVQYTCLYPANWHF
jgi:hypothetical protein